MSVSRYVMDLRRNPQKRIRADFIKEADCAKESMQPDSLPEVDLAVLDNSHEHEHDHDHSHGCGCQECEEDNSVLHEPEHSPGYMMKQNLFLISQMAEGLYHLVNENDMLPPWMEQKITTAFNEIQSVHRNAEYAKEEEREGMHHVHGDHEDLEEDLAIQPSGIQIKESFENDYDSPDLLVLEEASEVLANAENEITNLAKIATMDGNRMTLAKASRQLRDFKTDIRARVAVEKMKMRTRG